MSAVCHYDNGRYLCQYIIRGIIHMLLQAGGNDLESSAHQVSVMSSRKAVPKTFQHPDYGTILKWAAELLGFPNPPQVLDIDYS